MSAYGIIQIVNVNEIKKWRFAFCVLRFAQEIFFGHSFFIFVFPTIKALIQFIVNKICQWLDLNQGSLVSEATALPNAFQDMHGISRHSNNH